MSINSIINILSSYEFSIHDEKILQFEIAEVFTFEKIEFKKEVVLANGIIDFMIGDIGLEIKIKGQPMSIFRQLERYAQDDNINAIILANVKTMTLPDIINGKIARSVTIRGAL